MIIRTGPFRGYFDWAVRDDIGAEDRQFYMGSKPTPMDSIIHHSLEGLYYGPSSYAAFRDPGRFPTLWTWTVKRTGLVSQHAPVFQRTVHAHAGNAHGPGGESEGFTGEPLTDAQVRAWRHIHADMGEYTGIDYKRIPGSRRGLVEHREFGPTTCPNGRYEPLWRAIAQEDDMTPEEKAMLLELWRRTGGDKGRNFNLLQLVDNQNTALTKHKDEHPGGDGFPEHRHTIATVNVTGGVQR